MSWVEAYNLRMAWISIYAYDWIFSHGIKGFITMYGGANSHMAIRAGELGIPAAVGVGSKDFEEYKKAHVLELDPLAKWIRVLK